MSNKMHPMPFKGVPEGYTVNFLAKNFWKVSKGMQWDDALQEARVVYVEVCQKYPDVQDPHLMALYKTALRNHFIDLAKADTAHRQHVVFEADLHAYETESESVLAYTDRACAGDDSGEAAYLNTKIEQAPSEVKIVLSLFLNAPAELLEMATAAWKFSGRKKALGNNMLNKCLGLPEGSDPLGTVERYFLQKD